MSESPGRVLLADDDPIGRRAIQRALEKGGWVVEAVEDGTAALERLRRPDPPRVAVLDWIMPGVEGPEVCRAVRGRTGQPYTYLLILTARDRTEDVVKALEAGADEYLVKPFHPEELRARLRTASRIIALEQALADRVRELEEQRQHTRALAGLLPVCMHCRRIRDERQRWEPFEAYLARHSDLEFTHSLCEDCLRQHHPREAERMAREDEPPRQG